MAKRPDNDSTMDVSMSQLVPDAQPRGRPPKAPINPNDMSVWKQVVVGSADFAPPPKARSGRGRKLAIGGAVFAVAAAGGGVVAWRQLASDKPPAPAASSASAGDAP